MTYQLLPAPLPPPKIDPYWNEIVLSPGAIEESGQVSLLYDDGSEPPDPDDYRTLEEFQIAWDEWEKRNPHLVSEVRAMSDECCDRPAPEQTHPVAPEQCRPGDFVKLDTQWLDKCAAALVGTGHQKDYQYKTESDLICKVILVDDPPGTCIYVKRGKWALPVPRGKYSVLEQVADNTINTPKPDNTVLEQVKKSAPEHTQWLEEYKVIRYGKEHIYYRYCYMVQRKIHHVHIGGGNVRSPIAQARKAAVESAIAFGESPSEINKC